MEKFSTKKADRVITVIEENKERIVKKYSINKEKVFVVSNTVDLEVFGNSEIDAKILKAYSEKFVILYAGWVSPERGLETPIIAMEKLKELIPNPLLLIVGNGVSVETLNKMVSKNNLNSFVKFVPWCGHEKINAYMRASNIGIISHPVEEFIDTTITHKLFEYMSQELPVLVPNSKPFLRIINETKAGLIFESENPKSFAEKVFEIYNSEVDFGANGLKAVKEKYNWQNEEKKLIELYEDLKKEKNLN